MDIGTRKDKFDVESPLREPATTQEPIVPETKETEVPVPA